VYLIGLFCPVVFKLVFFSKIYLAMRTYQSLSTLMSQLGRRVLSD